MKSVKIKFCHFKHKEDVQKALDLGVDFLGFHFFNRQGDQRLLDLLDLIPKHCPSQNVLLTDLSLPLLYNALNALPVHTVQLYRLLSVPDIQILKNTFPHLKVLMVYSVKEEENFLGPEDFILQYSPVVDGFLLDSHFVGGTGKLGDIRNYVDFIKKTDQPVFIAGGLDSENIANILHQVPAYGVDVQTGVEVKTSNGTRKCPLKMQTFILAVKNWLKDN